MVPTAAFEPAKTPASEPAAYGQSREDEIRKDDFIGRAFGLASRLEAETGRKIFFNHFPAVAEKMADDGGFDLVCHGHDHLKRWEKKNATYILNPGTAGGMFQYPSFAIVDLATMTHQFIEVTL